MATVHLETSGIDIDQQKYKAYLQEDACKEAIKVAESFNLELEVQEWYARYREEGMLPAAAYNAALFEWDL